MKKPGLVEGAVMALGLAMVMVTVVHLRITNPHLMVLDLLLAVGIILGVMLLEKKAGG